MTKLEAIIRPVLFESIKEALIAVGVDGMTVSEVRGMEGKKATPKSIAVANTRRTFCQK